MGFLVVFMHGGMRLLVLAWIIGLMTAGSRGVAWGQEKTGGYATDAFELGAGKMKRSGWGNYAPNERRYFEEYLPALFERTLVTDSLAEGRGFKWVFNGERASLTIECAGGGKLSVWIEYYDSPGFNGLVAKPGTYPRLIQNLTNYKMPAGGSPKAITVRLDQSQMLSVGVDGSAVFGIHWLQTFSHHQLRLSGSNGAASFRMLSPVARAAAVTVEAGKTHQRILGWGGIGTPTAYHELSAEGRRQWWQWVAEYNLLFQREYPTGGNLHETMDNWDHPADAKAHYYGDNFPNGETSDFAYNRAIQELGGFVIFEFWDFPQWVGSDPARYAAAMLNYCQTAKARTGRAPYAVGVQNEMAMKPELVEPFVSALRETLDEHGFNAVKIHMANAPTIRTAMERLPAYRENPAVWSKIDFAAANDYDIQGHLQKPDGIDPLLRAWHERVGEKPFLATEICVNDPAYQTDGYLLALVYGEMYHKLLTLADASIISYCWTIVNIEQPSFAASRSLFRVARQNDFVPEPSGPQLRVYGAYSRHVAEGMVRVEAASDDPDLLAAAFTGENGRETAVLLNRGIAAVTVKLNWPGARLPIEELTDPYHRNTPVDGYDAGAQRVAVPAGGIVTLSNVPLLTLPNGFQAP
jgi:hypothetical protein